jgi:hypothetical protein
MEQLHETIGYLKSKLISYMDYSLKFFSSIYNLFIILSSIKIQVDFMNQ